MGRLILEARKLRRSADGKTILHDVDLGIETGDVFALIGPTGAGKTTLLRLLDLIDRPESGRVVFDDIDVTSQERARLEARRRMAYVQQKPIVFSGDVGRNVGIGLSWRRVEREEAARRVNDALQLVDMAGFAERDAGTLSGGETQRVALARALVTDPEVVFLDEPTANLDPVSTDRIEGVLERIIARGETTVVMSTHDMTQGQRLATRMGVLVDGRLRQVGSPGEVFRSPADEIVAGFVGVGNMLPGMISRRIDPGLVEVDVGGGTIDVVSTWDPGTPVWAVVRTEDVTFSSALHRTSARNGFTGPVTRIEPASLVVRVEIDCGFPLIGVATSRSVAEMALQAGAVINASFKATAVHLIHRRPS